MSLPCHDNRIIAEVWRNQFGNYIVLLVLVVGHDGDDGVVNEQAKGQDPREAWEWWSENRNRYKKYKNTDVEDDLDWIGLLKIPGKGDVLLTGDITELSIDSPPVSMIQSV